MCDFNIGDYVEIINPGSTYSHYIEYFEYFDFKNKKYNKEFLTGEEGIVFGLEQHERWVNEIILAVQHKDGRQCLIRGDGVIKHNMKYRNPFKLYRKWGRFNDLSF